MNICEELFELKDDEYRKFNSRLLPTVNPERIIGVRVPLIRKLVKKFSKLPDAAKFLKELPHKYYEEDLVHVLLIGEIRDFDVAIEARERVLPCIDNWAVCDVPMPKVFCRNKERLLPYAEKWIKSEHPYTVRYGIKVLMDLFLDGDFDIKYPEMVSRIKSDEYYVNMMIAWYFATALAKQYGAVLPYIEGQRLEPWIHNKTIQKAVESYRIDAETKNYLKTLKCKD